MLLLLLPAYPLSVIPFSLDETSCQVKILFDDAGQSTLSGHHCCAQQLRQARSKQAQQLAMVCCSVTISIWLQTSEDADLVKCAVEAPMPTLTKLRQLLL